MTASWYLLFVREPGKTMPKVPLVGNRVVHYLGKSEDEEKQRADKDNPMWAKIQDGVRPAWSPDLLRLGYTVVWQREGLPKLAVKLGLKNPAKLKKDSGGMPQQDGAGKRVLTFDDVFVVGVDPEKSPFYMPSGTLGEEEWWLATRDRPKLTSPFIAPSGVTVLTGAQRLADVVAQMLSTVHGYPRSLPPSVNDPSGIGSYDEFDNNLEKVEPLPQSKSPQEAEKEMDPQGARQGQGFAGLQLFRGY